MEQYRMPVVNMRAVRFKCIYNMIVGSHEPRHILKRIPTSCDQEQSPGALKPRRREPWLCVSIPGSWAVRLVLTVSLLTWAELPDGSAQRQPGAETVLRPSAGRATAVPVPGAFSRCRLGGLCLRSVSPFGTTTVFFLLASKYFSTLELTFFFL